jgi:hypothetical protein
VKIWSKLTGNVIYDNQKTGGVSDPDDAAATQPAPTGSVTVTFAK